MFAARRTMEEAVETKTMKVLRDGPEWLLLGR